MMYGPAAERLRRFDKVEWTQRGRMNDVYTRKATWVDPVCL